MTLNLIDIIKGTTVDGPGFRTAIYLAGCNHYCAGCHNPHTHNPDAGTAMSIEQILDVVREEDFDVTLTGGDPLYYPHKCLALAKAIKQCGYNIWLYTGYTWTQILQSPELSAVLPYIDVVVDGRYDQSQRDTDLRFRGSRNQRIIDVRKSLNSNKISERNNNY